MRKGVKGVKGVNVPHLSDCAVYNEPAYPNGSCDCGAVGTSEYLSAIHYKRSDEEYYSQVRRLLDS